MPAGLPDDRRTAPAGDAARRVPHLERVRAPGHIEHRAAVEEAPRPAPVERRRHDQQPQVVAARATPAGRGPAPRSGGGSARGTRRRPASDVTQKRVRLQQAVRMPSVDNQQRACRGPKRRSKRTWKPTSRAERPALLLGDAPGHRPGGHAPRLQHEDAGRAEERRRHPRGLARPRRRDEDGGAQFRPRRRARLRRGRRWGGAGARPDATVSGGAGPREDRRPRLASAFPPATTASCPGASGFEPSDTRRAGAGCPRRS